MKYHHHIGKNRDRPQKTVILISLRNYRDVLSICRYSELMTVESLNTLNTERLITKTIDKKKHAIILVEASNVAPSIRHIQ
jgi:hypothetical protein